jgi:RNA polymerase sigma-70 factor (ECF subfamily)
MTPDDDFSRRLIALRRFLLNNARNMTRDSDAAEDLASETVLRAWRYRHQFDPATNLQSWCCIIMRNQWLTTLRRAKFNVGSTEGLPEPSCPAPQHIILDALDAERAMARLPAAMRETVTLIAVGATIEQAAKVTGVAEGTVKSRTGRGRKMLAEMCHVPG